MKKRMILLLMVGFLSVLGNEPSAYAVNIALQMGGNCEKAWGREGINNGFLKRMGLEREKMNYYGWDTITLYNGNTEPFTEYLKTKDTATGNTFPSSKEEFLKKLDAIITQTEAGDPESNQVLISMNSHGSSGGICISETEILNYDDPDLQKRLERLKKSSKIGIIANACYSGTAINPLSQFGCVISSQAGNVFSISEQNQYIWGWISLSGEKASSMEDFYLNLQASSDLNIPQISGFPEGSRISEAYFSQFTNRHVANWYSNLDFSNGTCKKELISNELATFFKEMEKFQNDQRLTELYGQNKPNHENRDSILSDLAYLDQKIQSYEILSNDQQKAFVEFSATPKPELDLEFSSEELKAKAVSLIEQKIDDPNFKLFDFGIDGNKLLIAPKLDGESFNSKMNKEEMIRLTQSVVGAIQKELGLNQPLVKKSSLDQFGSNYETQKKHLTHFRQIQDMMDSIEKTEYDFVGKAVGTSISSGQNEDKHLAQVHELNRNLSALYLNTKTENLSPEDQAARKACQNFQMKPKYKNSGSDPSSKK